MSTECIMCPWDKVGKVPYCFQQGEQLSNNDPPNQIKIGNRILIDQIIQSPCQKLAADEILSLENVLNWQGVNEEQWKLLSYTSSLFIYRAQLNPILQMDSGAFERPKASFYIILTSWVNVFLSEKVNCFQRGSSANYNKSQCQCLHSLK